MARTLSARRRVLAVVCGGFCGTLLRLALSTLIQSHLGKTWPYDILCINISGALVLAFVTVLADATLLVGPTRRLFINVGLLGAYTTFSSLALGDVLLIAAGHWLSALLYVVVSCVGGILAVLIGELLGRGFVRAIRRPSRAVVADELKSAASLDAAITAQHIAVQDDLLQSAPSALPHKGTKKDF